MQQPTNPSEAQVVVFVQGMPATTQKGFRNMKERYALLLIILGAAQIVIGILCTTVQGCIYGVSNSGPVLRVDGTWAGILFIVTGTFGIRGGKKKGSCQVVTFNVLSIMSAIFAAYVLSLASFYAMYESFMNYYARTSVSHGAVFLRDDVGNKVEINAYIILAVLAVLEVITAIWSSVVCCYIGACYDDCGPSCCCPSDPENNELVNTIQPQQQSNIGYQQQEMFKPNEQQPMFFTYQPMTDSQQHGAQYFPYQPTAMLIPQKSDFSALSSDAKGKGPHAKTQPGGKDSGESPISFDDTKPFARVYNDD